MNKNIVDTIAMILVITGAIAWGAYAFGFEIVASVFGKFAWAIYGLVGASGIWQLYRKFA